MFLFTPWLIPKHKENQMLNGNLKKLSQIFKYGIYDFLDQIRMKFFIMCILEFWSNQSNSNENIHVLLKQDELHVWYYMEVCIEVVNSSLKY